MQIGNRVVFNIQILRCDACPNPKFKEYGNNVSSGKGTSSMSIESSENEQPGQQEKRRWGKATCI